MHEAGPAAASDRETLGWLRWDHAVQAALDPRRTRERVELSRRRYRQDALLRLPPLLRVTDSLTTVRLPAATAHFVGTRCVDGLLLLLPPGARPRQLPTGAVIAIESADPGYDWIFASSPSALLTAFGGPHSHMALRCLAHDCTGALGVGMDRFWRLASATRLHIDPVRQLIRVDTGLNPILERVA